MSIKPFEHIGFGIGFRPCHYDQILTTLPKSIDWLEVITENFMSVGGKPRRILEETREHYPIAIHGVGMSIGSPEPISKLYLSQLKELVSWLKPALISDHLCYTKFRNHNSHDLLPVPYSKAMLERIVSRVDEVQQLLGRRFLLENPSAYVAFAENDFTESEFLAELVTKTGCGILLDVNNVFVNQMNLGANPLVYLNNIPNSCVGQIHLAGHSIETNELGTVRIDTHDHPVNDEVWEMYRMAIKKWPNASPMIEWDDHIPELDDLLKMLDHARTLTPKDITPYDIAPQALTPSTKHLYSDVQVQNLFALATDSQGLNHDDSRLEYLASNIPVPKLLGAMVYNNAYFSRLRDVLKDEFPTLAGVTTEDGFDAIAASFLEVSPSSDADVGLLGKKLSDHLAICAIENIDFGVSLTALSEIAKLDRTRAEAFTHIKEAPSITKNVLAEVEADQWEVLKLNFNPTISTFSTQYAIAPIWSAIDNGESPNLPQATSQDIIVWRWNEHVYHEVLVQHELPFFNHMQSGETFASAVNRLPSECGESLEEKSNFAIQRLIHWFDIGLITGIYI